MKRFKQLSLALVSGLLLAGLLSCSNTGQAPVSAEDQAITFAEGDAGGPELGPGMGFHGKGLMAEVLGLSDEQKQQIREIRQANKPDIRALRQSGKSWDEIRAERRAAREKTHEQVMAVLTPEQREKAEAIHKQLEAGEIPQELADAHMRRLSEKLNLTPEQQEQIRALDFGKKLLALRHDDDLDRKQRREQHRQLRQEFHDQLQKILTPEQQEQLEKLHEERRNRLHERRERFGHHRAGGRVAHLTEALDLSPEQQEQIEAIFEEFRSELKGPASPGKGNRELFRQKREELHDKIAEILTPEQLVKFQEMRGPRFK